MKKRNVLLLTVVLTVLATLVFSTPGFSQPPIPPGVEQLRRDAGGEVEITWNPRIGTPSFIRGRISLSAVGLTSEEGPATAALTLVDRYAELFGVRQASQELNITQTDVDTLGMKHVTLGQVYQGIEVYGAYMKVHLSADGQEVVAISSGFVPDIRLPDTQPRIGADQALAAARKALSNGTLLSGPKLVVYPGAGETSGASARLAWLVELRDDSIPARNVYVVDATEGTILDVLDRLYEQVVGSGIATLQGAMQQQPVYNTAFLTDAQLEDYNSMTSEQIREFLVSHGSFYQRPIEDVDGVTFDPPEVIAQAATEYRISPKVLLATLQKESSAVTSGNSGNRSFLMGCGEDVPLPEPANTARGQLWCAAEKFRAYHDELNNTGSTRSGWQVGVSKDTQDGVTVTPATKAVAGQFTYTPYAGVQWGGNQPSVGGVYLFYYAWNQFGFNGCPVGQYHAEYYNNRTLTGDPTFTRCEDAPIVHDWGDGGPGNGVSNDDFSVRWTGWFTFTEDTFNFAAQTDDGLRVWVDGTLIIDAWWDQPPTFYQASYDLTAGEHEVKAEYYERGGGAVAHVRWWGSTSDPDDGRITSSNETLWGTIEPSDDTDSYYFDATQGQNASIRMTKSSFTPSLDPYLILYAPDGSEVTRDDDSGGDLNALINRVPLTQTGRYRIEAKSYAGNSNGLYSLSLTLHQPGQPNRETYDADHGYSLPGTLARSEGDDPTGDQDVDNAHDFAGETYDYYWNTHNRDGYDDQGATLISTANYGYSYMNAFWNGEQVVYGDGFPVKDVVAHEWTHAVTEHSAELEYRWQSGALNESFSDIFGAMVDRDDWLMGEDLPPDVLAGREAIRDLSDPPRFGQPDHTDDWRETCSDNEGVHTNSGITNKAYYNIATAIGKDKAEQIFYRALTVYLDTNSSLEDARAKALQSAEDLYGNDSPEYNAVRDGFNAVGLDGQWNPPSNDCTCAATTALSDETVYSDQMSALEVAATLYWARDQLSSTAAGEHYRPLYEQHTGRISHLLLLDSALRTTGGQILQEVTPGLNQLMDGHGDESVVTEEMVTEVIAFLQRLAEEDRANGGGELAETIEREMVRIDWDYLVGMTFEEAWVYINSRITVHLYTIYLPVVLR